jgi:catechol 2,3-dioxygenase-like lactoylglutathione lyase family enzyme
MPRRRVVIDHVTISVSDLRRSQEFYVQALIPLGFSQIGAPLEEGREIEFGLEEAPNFAISTAYPTGAPVHVAFAADRREQVDAFHQAALAAGGRDNGAPGPRPKYSEGYYGAFVLDPDGHNIEAVFHGQA